MKNILLLTSSIFFVFFIFQSVTAQNFNLKDVYEKNVIRPQANLFMRNDETLYKRQVYSLLLIYDESASEFALYRKHLTTSRILSAANFVTTILFSSLLDRPNQTDFYLYGGTSLTLGISSMFFRAKSINHFNNSLWAYNRDILLTQY